MGDSKSFTWSKTKRKFLWDKKASGDAKALKF